MLSLRAEADAILIGATNLRADNPDLAIPTDERAARRARGAPEPARIVVTTAGEGITPDQRIFDPELGGPAIVLHAPAMPVETRARLGAVAELVQFMGDRVAHDRRPDLARRPRHPNAAVRRRRRRRRPALRRPRRRRALSNAGPPHPRRRPRPHPRRRPRLRASTRSPTRSSRRWSALGTSCTCGTSSRGNSRERRASERATARGRMTLGNRPASHPPDARYSRGAWPFDSSGLLVFDPSQRRVLRSCKGAPTRCNK